MSKKESLQKVLNDFNSRRILRIELLWADGQKTDINNSQALGVAMSALKNELEKQISES